MNCNADPEKQTNRGQGDGGPLAGRGARKPGRLPGAAQLPSACRRRTLLANDSKARKESSMAISGRHQSPKPTAPQLASLGTLPPGIQTDAIECHRADHLLYLHGWLTTTACLPTVQTTHLLRNAVFDAAAQGTLPLRGRISRLLAIAGQHLRSLLWRQSQFAPFFERA